jgi:hypothetical protein
MNFLVIDGEGDPASPQYMAAIEALFGVSYALKFMVKKGKGVDYAVMPLEGLWYSAEGPSIAKIHAFTLKSGHALSGKHHEICLNNPSKTAPEKLKTILRQPMK